MPSSRDAVFEDVTLVEPGQPSRPGRRLEVAGGEIRSVDRALAGAGTAQSEFAGLYVTPGLIDLHVHHPPSFAPGGRQGFGLLFLAHGVTSVRDTGSLWGSATSLARASRDGTFAGPRVFACGPFLTGVAPPAVGMQLVENREEAIAAVDELAAAGVDCIKLHNGLSRESAVALIERAHERGLPVVAHVGEFNSITIMDRVEVQHLMKLSPSWSRVRHDAIEDYVEMSIGHEVAHTPTLVVFDEVARRAAGAPAPESARFLPGYLRDLLWDETRNPTIAALDASVGDAPEDRIAVMKQLTKSLYEAGVPLQLGTDTPNPGVVPGESAQRELALLVEAGLPLDAAWLAATRAAGERLGVPKLGTLDLGAPADLLFFREDPTRDLAALDSLEAVMVGGRLYRKRELEAALEQYREYFDAPLYDGLSRLLTRGVLWWMTPAPASAPQ